MMQSLNDTALRKLPGRTGGISSFARLQSRICIRLSCPTPWINWACAIRPCGNTCVLCMADARSPDGRAPFRAPTSITSRTIPTPSRSKRWIACCPGEVAVVGTAKSTAQRAMGRASSTAARARGARGAVIDGLVRDVRQIEELGFPVFAAGIKPVDSMGRGVVTAYNVPVECGEVLVHPGDFVFADFDGVVVVPKAIVKQVIELAADKVRRENNSRAELMKGAYLRDVFAEIRCALERNEYHSHRNHTGDVPIRPEFQIRGSLGSIKNLLS